MLKAYAWPLCTKSQRGGEGESIESQSYTWPRIGVKELARKRKGEPQMNRLAAAQWRERCGE
jgi:hypothetical protein